MKTILAILSVVGTFSSAFAGPRDFVECRFFDQNRALSELGTRNFTTDSDAVRTIETLDGKQLYSVNYSGSLDRLNIEFCVDSLCSEKQIDVDVTEGTDLLLSTPTGLKKASCFGYEG